MRWRFVDTGERDGPYNMAVDEALVRACRSGLSGPVLRVYRWKPWTVSIGRMESTERSLDLTACRADGVPVVRRPTGGRGVFHAEELTYSVIARPADLPVEATVGETYRFIAKALAGALRMLGVPAEVWPPEGGTDEPRSRGCCCGAADGTRPAERGRARATRVSRGSPCFASVSRYEICVDRRKLVGSAQRRWSDCLLQHGSILLGPAHRKIESYLRSRTAGIEALSECTTSVSEVLGRSVEPQKLAQCLREAAAGIWKVEMGESRLTRQESAAAAGLAERKYRTDEWNLRIPSEAKSDESPAALR